MNKKTILFIFGFMLVLVAGWQGWQEVKAQGADWLPVKHVRIEGAFQYIAKERIKKVLLAHVVNGFYNADIQQIQASVESLSWADAVRVKRVWPDAIHVQIDEQLPIVRWGEEALLNSKGETFKPAQIDDFIDLPLLVGPVGYQVKMLEVVKELSIALATENMKLAEFQVNERRAWKIKLQNKIVLNAGRNQPLKKIQRFLNTVSLLQKQQIAEIAVVDLRYSNGYALTWKQGESIIDWKKIAEMNKT